MKYNCKLLRKCYRLDWEVDLMLRASSASLSLTSSTSLSDIFVSLVHCNKAVHHNSSSSTRFSSSSVLNPEALAVRGARLALALSTPASARPK